MGKVNPLRQRVDEKEGYGRAATLDRATVLGITATLGLILGIMILGSGSGALVFWQTPALALVIGGSILATLAAVPGAQFRSLPAVLRNALYVRTRPPEETIAILVSLAEVARRQGMLALERPVRLVGDDFLRRAMQMAIDGADGATIDAVLRSEMEAIDLRHTCGKALFESIGRFAPVFGMIGTVIGLVVMLGHMDDPTKIGPGMAVALLTTLYGLVLANVLCAPIARKLAHRSSEELLGKMIALRGVLAIQAGDHPRIVEQKLRAYLPGGGMLSPAVASDTSAAARPSEPGSASREANRKLEAA